jgi:RNA polymerase sigma-70 factor, ECF subfamily
MTRPDPEHFERLVRQQHAAVFRSARRLCADDAVAADVAQEVFVRLWEGKVRLDEVQNERATLCWLAARLAANAARGRRRRQDHEENAMRARREVSTDPVHETTALELQQVVAGHVAELPAELRVPLLMRHQDELTLAAIGTALRLPVSTVHDRITNALDRLRQRLGRAEGAGGMALPALLSTIDAPPAPVGLEARLLGVGSAPAVGVAPFASSKALVLGGAVAFLLTFGAIAYGVFSGDEGRAPSESTTAMASTASADRGEQDPVPQPRSQPSADPARRAAPAAPLVLTQEQAAPSRAIATFTGTVHDAEA